MFPTHSTYIVIKLLFDLGAFLLLLLPADISVIEDDLIDLILVILFLEVDLLIQPVQLFLEFLDGDLFELYFAFQFLVLG
jgi:hypothetical protein